MTEEEERVLQVGLSRDKLIQVGRFSSSENFVCERVELVVYAFLNFWPV